MTILEKIKQTQLEFRKAGNPLAITLTTLISDIEIIGKNSGGRVPTDDESVKEMNKFIKNLQVSHKAYESQDNPRSSIRAKELLAEINIIQLFLPPIPIQLTDKELRFCIIDLVHRHNSFSSQKLSLREILTFLKSNYSNQYDGALAVKIAKEILGI